MRQRGACGGTARSEQLRLQRRDRRAQLAARSGDVERIAPRRIHLVAQALNVAAQSARAYEVLAAAAIVISPKMLRGGKSNGQ